jgi:5-(carboxyamino)imidazole ribonucleotide synthase
VTIGIVGAGQLGQMMALAGYPLGLDFLFVDQTADTPAGRIAPVMPGDMGDVRLLRRLAQRSDVLSIDWENVDVDALRRAAGRTRVSPPLRAIATAQDRILEKRAFVNLSIPTTRFEPVDSRRTLGRAIDRIGLPGVLKTRRFGYDGKGQRVVRSGDDAERAWQELGSAALIYEELVPFDYEVSIIGARSRRGEIVVYPLNRNYHAGGILHLTVAPWHAPALARQAVAALRRVLDAYRYIGILAIEFFVAGRRLIANEMAPRVHNSGHWTIEGTVTSQFENHVRAITGMPLGDPSPRGHAAMINLIGSMPDSRAFLAERDLHWHDYGKQPRPGRKLGHCTLIEHSVTARNARSRKLLRRLYPHGLVNP